MFTGLIEEIGTIRQPVSAGGRLEISAHQVLQRTKIGDSIAVNGVCLTVTQLGGSSFSVTATPETLQKSALAQLTRGHKVNLERAMVCGGRFDGHLVAGHIDGTGKILRQTRQGNSILIEIEASAELMQLIVKKGSVAVDGISLTVADLTPSSFITAIIPHTGTQTTLTAKQPGEQVNLETDLVGKYVQKLLQAPAPALTLDLLHQNGF